MSEQLSPVHEEPSLLDDELEKARNSVRGRMTRRMGRFITGKDHPLEIVSGKEADLSAIKNAGSHEASLGEVDQQLEKARTSVRGRMTRRIGRWITGENHPVEIVSGKEARLAAIKDELERKRSNY